jgi:hypothetical protein
MLRDVSVLTCSRCLGEQFDCGDDRGRPQEAEAEGGGEGEGEGGEEEITPPYQETARGQSPHRPPPTYILLRSS